MSNYKESLQIIKQLLEKSPNELNALDRGLAQKHLLELYSYFEFNALEEELKEAIILEEDSQEEKESKHLYDVKLVDTEEQGEEDLSVEIVEEEIMEEKINPVEEKKEQLMNELFSMEDYTEESLMEETFMDKADEVIEEVVEEIAEEIAEEEIIVELAKDIEEEVKEGKIEMEEDNLTSMSLSFDPPLSDDDFLSQWQPKENVVEVSVSDVQAIEEEPVEEQLEETVIDALAQTKSSINEISEDLNLSNQSKSRDIKTLIGLNDAYLFTNELFKNRATYEKSLAALNELNSEEDALNYLKDILPAPAEDKDNEDETLAAFYELVHRFYKIF